MSQNDMWQRFTNPATRVIHFAQEEAKRLGMNVVGTEHILLGLIREGEGVAFHVLERLGATLVRMRSEYARRVGTPEGHIVGSTRLTLSPKAKKALEYALQEACELTPMLGSENFVDTEHLLLGLIHEGNQSGSKAVRLLEGLGIDLRGVRKDVLHYLGADPEAIASLNSRGRVLDLYVIPEELLQILTIAGKQVLYFASAEANSYGHDAIGTEHLLLGLCRVNDGLASMMLQEADLELTMLHSVCGVLFDYHKKSPTTQPVQLPMTANALQSLQFATEEAAKIRAELGGSHEVDTEHILLGMIKVGYAGKGVRLLHFLNRSDEWLRPAIARALHGVAIPSWQDPSIYTSCLIARDLDLRFEIWD